MAVQLRHVPDNTTRDCQHRMAGVFNVLHIQLGYFGVFMGFSQRGEWLALLPVDICQDC